MKNRHTVTDHPAAARRARKQRGVWVPGPVYPTVESAQAAARRVPLARGLTAYLPIGDFEAYGARCWDGGALWVRHIGGDGPDLEPMPQRMTVRVSTLLGNGRGYEGTGIVTVAILPTCPVCGGPRGWDRVHADPFMRDGTTLVRDRWSNPCGHADMYDAVLAEARRTPPAPGGLTPEDAPALKLPQLRFDCTKCGAKAGELCTSHKGKRFRLVDVHTARTESWNTARVAATPAAQIVLDAANRQRGMHGRQAADLIAGHGFAEEAAYLDSELKIQNGHLSAKQAVVLLVERADALARGES
ncbi:hypothetical protein [Streptomyces canus]|uniref:zinc finger domain-containing protein n=1 Tax=Streptomyces canus TaxID=58343 RepID=UPI002E2557FF